MDIYECSEHSKDECKSQEWIQSSNTPDPSNHNDTNKRLHPTKKSKEVSPFPAGHHKAASNRHDSIIKTNVRVLITKGFTKGASPRNGR